MRATRSWPATPRSTTWSQGEIEKVNRDLAADRSMAGSQIRRFLILHKELDADDGELTRTRKVRRGFIAERYARADRRALRRLAQCHIEVEVTFEDGRKGTIEGDVEIRDLATQPCPAPAAAEGGAEAAAIRATVASARRVRRRGAAVGRERSACRSAA